MLVKPAGQASTGTGGGMLLVAAFAAFVAGAIYFDKLKHSARPRSRRRR